MIDGTAFQPRFVIYHVYWWITESLSLIWYSRNICRYMFGSWFMHMYDLYILFSMPFIRDKYYCRIEIWIKCVRECIRTREQRPLQNIDVKEYSMSYIHNIFFFLLQVSWYIYREKYMCELVWMSKLLLNNNCSRSPRYDHWRNVNENKWHSLRGLFKFARVASSATKLQLPPLYMYWWWF